MNRGFHIDAIDPAPGRGRLLLVSNRLPVTAQVDATGVHVEPSSGGLATGLRGPHERMESMWIGWPGDLPKLRARRRAELDERLAELRCVPIHLSRTEIRRFYDEISNGVLWPLFHYLIDQIPAEARGFADLPRCQREVRRSGHRRIYSPAI